MGLFSSSSKSSTTNNQTSANAPIQVSEYGRAFNFQNLEGPLSVQTLDPVVIQQVVELADRVNENTFTFSDLALKDAYKNVDNSYEFAGGILGAANSTINNAMESSAALSQGVVVFAGDQMENTREFSAGAIGAVSSFAKQALESNLFASSQAMESVDKSTDKMGDVFALSMLSVDKAGERSASFVGEAFNASLDAVEVANQSETAKLTEKVLYGALALAAIVAFQRFA